MKTINLELSKRLHEWGWLDGIETEHCWSIDNKQTWYQKYSDALHGQENWICNYDFIFKALTLEEAIGLLPTEVWYLQYKLYITKHKELNRFITWEYQIYYFYWIDSETLKSVFWETLLEAIEKMLTYLLDNDLLWKQ